MRVSNLNPVDFFLNSFQEPGGVCAVHLGVMELEGDGQGPFLKVAPVFAPDQEGIVEYAAVHADGSVYIVLRQGRRAYDHAVGKVVVLTAFGYLTGQAQIVGVELFQVVRKGDVAGAYFPVFIGDNGADGYAVVLDQLLADWKHIELLGAACRPSYAPAHQHVEFHPGPPAHPDQTGYVQCLEKGEHRHRGGHPHLEGIGPCRLARIDFSHLS